MDRIKVLKGMIRNKDSMEEIKALYESIDTDVFRLCKSAEKKCRKLPSNLKIKEWSGKVAKILQYSTRRVWV